MQQAGLSIGENLVVMVPSTQEAASMCSAYAVKPDAQTGGNAFFCLKNFDGRAVTEEQYQAVLGMTAPFDALQGAGFFSLGLGIVCACFLISHGVGAVIGTLR